MFFYALQVSFEKVYYTLAEELDKLFWAKLNEKNFVIVEKTLEHLESREIWWVQRPKNLTISVGPRCKPLIGRIRCLYNNVIYRLCAGANQPKNGRRDHTLCLDPSQLALIHEKIVQWA